MTNQGGKPTNLYEYLDLVRVRPPMYIGAKSISRLRDFINGYIIGCWVHETEQELYPAWNGFDDFVSTYFGNESTSGWAIKILEKCDHDEERAVDLFFELLDLYRNKIMS